MILLLWPEPVIGPDGERHGGSAFGAQLSLTTYVFLLADPDLYSLQVRCSGLLR